MDETNLSLKLITEVENQVNALYKDFEQFKSTKTKELEKNIKAIEENARKQITLFEADQKEELSQSLKLFEAEQEQLKMQKFEELTQEIKVQEKLLVDKILMEVFSRYGS